MVLVQLKLIIEKNNKKQEEFFKETKVYKTKNFQSHLIMHIKIELGLSIFYFYLYKST